MVRCGGVCANTLCTCSSARMKVVPSGSCSMNKVGRVMFELGGSTLLLHDACGGGGGGGGEEFPGGLFPPPSSPPPPPVQPAAPRNEAHRSATASLAFQSLINA